MRGMSCPGKRGVPRRKDEKGDHNRSERLARGAAWTVDVFARLPKLPLGLSGSQGIGALVLAGDRVFAAGRRGRLMAFAAADGKLLAQRGRPPPVWDGMAAAHGRLYVATRDGSVICLGERP